MPPGTAVFETVSQESLEGIVLTPMYNISPQVQSSGVILYEVDGISTKILFGEKDFKVGLSVHIVSPLLDTRKHMGHWK